MTQVLMIQGTTSGAGKSTLVAGLCRLLARRGVRVAPFKPQNMSLNSAVSQDGGEIGRAQALQAFACGLEPHSDMNPVLLKPNTDTGAQVIIQGKALATMEAQDYHAYKRRAREAVLESFHRLSKAYDFVVVEGAGSPAEVNLREGDIANMGFAEAVDCPVVLIADINPGGVFAHLLGTLALLSESEQNRVIGFVINNFRGDISLLQPGLDWLEQHTGKPVLGVLPFLPGLHLDAEDAIVSANEMAEGERLKVVIPVTPRISNHTDFDSLRLHPQVEVRFVGPGEKPPAGDLLILGGSKCVRADLKWLRDQGWEEVLQRHLRYGGKVLGLCGGFQMLGNLIEDPLGLEGSPGSCEGFGLLDLQTVLEEEKLLANVEGHWIANGAAVKGYEIHAGRTTGSALKSPLLRLSDDRTDGAISEDGQILGSYVHGLMDQPESLKAVLEWAGLKAPRTLDLNALRLESLDRLANEIEKQMNLSFFDRPLPNPLP